MFTPISKQDEVPPYQDKRQVANAWQNQQETDGRDDDWQSGSQGGGGHEEHHRGDHDGNREDRNVGWDRRDGWDRRNDRDGGRDRHDDRDGGRDRRDSGRDDWRSGRGGHGGRDNDRWRDDDRWRTDDRWHQRRSDEDSRKRDWGDKE